MKGKITGKEIIAGVLETYVHSGYDMVGTANKLAMTYNQVRHFVSKYYMPAKNGETITLRSKV